MTNGWVLPEGVLRDAPAYTPRPHELADLELILSGAYTPLTGFLNRADLTHLARTGRLVDGTPWPVPVTLEVPPGIVDQLDVDNPLGRVRRIGDGGQGPFRRLRRAPAEVRELLPPGRVLGVFADRPLHRPQLAQLAHATRTLAGHLLVLIPVSGPTADGISAESLVRCVLAARDRMPPATIVGVPLAVRGDEIRDALLRARVAGAFG